MMLFTKKCTACFRHLARSEFKLDKCDSCGTKKVNDVRGRCRQCVIEGRKVPTPPFCSEHC